MALKAKTLQVLFFKKGKQFTIQGLNSIPIVSVIIVLELLINNEPHWS